MNLWQMAFGEGVTKPIDAFGAAVDRIFTSDDERLGREEAMARIRASPYMAALQIATIEAQSGDKWTSRARPAVLYAFCTVFVLQNGLMPILWWLVQIFRPETPPPPAVLSMDMIMTVVSGVLGTSFIASRGAEKLSRKT